MSRYGVQVTEKQWDKKFSQDFPDTCFNIEVSVEAGSLKEAERKVRMFLYDAKVRRSISGHVSSRAFA